MRKLLLILLPLLALSACGTGRKLDRIRQQSLSPQVAPAQENSVPELAVGKEPERDTLVVEDPEGNQVLIMRAVKDDNGEMVATDVIQAAKVTAKFRNVAERGGKVDLCFRITVPALMQDRAWQLRFYPDLFVLEDSLRLDPILITGEDYRRAQLKGYQQYQRFLDSIVADSARFVDRFQLEMFLKRNLPEIYRFRTDSSEVSDELFTSFYGVTQQQAVDHYTNEWIVRRNRRKIERREEMFHRLVKVPIVSEGLRLDTVIRDAGGDIIYDYVQSIHVRPLLKKAEIVLRGDIYEADQRIYRIPASDPITFYISSLSGLTENTVRYKTQVVGRRVQANTACYIEFGQGQAAVLPELGDNRGEIGRIEENLRSLADNRHFDLDSIVVTASCSPEGGYSFNRKLSQRRSESVSAYFKAFLKAYRDSVKRAAGARLSLDDSFVEEAPQEIRFLSRNNPENWTMLDALVREDATLGEAERSAYAACREIADPDLREQRLNRIPAYRHIREVLYPRLRTVRFDFHLHRKGVQKDTVHTTVIDTAYMDGLQAIRDRDYRLAVTLLRPYHDYNSAVAYCALDYNASALDILEKLERTDRVNYLLAILYSRRGDDKQAVECYLQACRQNPQFVHRGNLDPEISSLIKKYKTTLSPLIDAL